jgi:hypothetical protein
MAASCVFGVLSPFNFTNAAARQTEQRINPQRNSRHFRAEIQMGAALLFSFGERLS